jgi:hypothetical protein
MKTASRTEQRPDPAAAMRTAGRLCACDFAPGKEPPAKEQLAHSKLCGKCVSFEKISGVAPASVPVLVSLDLLFAQPCARGLRLCSALDCRFPQPRSSRLPLIAVNDARGHAVAR